MIQIEHTGIEGGTRGRQVDIVRDGKRAEPIGRSSARDRRPLPRDIARGQNRGEQAPDMIGMMMSIPGTVSGHSLSLTPSLAL